MKRGTDKVLLLCLTFIFMVGIVSAWSVDITKLNNNVPTGYYNSGVNSFSYSVTNLNCPLDYSWIKYSLNGQSNQSLSCGNGESTFFPLSWIEGNNTLEIYVNDTSGTINSDNVSFWVDSISPILSVLNPLGNICYTNTNVLNLIAQLTETNKGGYHPSGNIDSSNRYFWRQFSYPSGGGSFNSYLLDSSNISDVSLPLSLGDQEEGNYTFIIKSRDKYPDGTTIREVTQTGVIIRDTLPPITSISSPLTGLYYSGIVNIINIFDGG